MEVIDQISSATKSNPLANCVNLLVELLNLTKQPEIRDEIREQDGITSLSKFAHDFLSAASVNEYFDGEAPDQQSYYPKTVINILRIFRNLCVNSTENQNIIRENEICRAAPFIIKVNTKITDASPPDFKILVRAGIQFFGNFVAANTDNAEYFWKLQFPSFFQSMLESTDDAAREHTSMLLYNCCRHSPELRLDLINSPVFVSVIAVLHYLQDKHDDIHSSCFHWIYLILLKVFSDGKFSTAYNALRIPDNLQRQYELQGNLLKVYDGMVEKVSEELPRRSSSDEPLDEQAVITPATCSFMVAELGRMYNKDFSRVADVAKESQAAGTPMPPLGSFATVLTTDEYELIYFMLHILGHVTGLVEECNSTRLCENGNDLRTNLGKEGLLALVVGTLRGLWEVEQAAKAKKEKVNFAQGYKRELMAIIANMSYNNKQNQDEVRELAGVELVLNHCNIDDNNPFIREWALFAVRNLLDDNPENQAIVQGLRAERVSDTHGFLQQMGMKADIVNGVLKFSKDADSPAHKQ